MTIPECVHISLLPEPLLQQTQTMLSMVRAEKDAPPPGAVGPLDTGLVFLDVDVGLIPWTSDLETEFESINASIFYKNKLY